MTFQTFNRVLKFIFLSCQMQQIELVEVFCDVNLDQYDRAIEESFTKLAFEAVEKIIKVNFTLISLGNVRYLEDELILPSAVHFSLFF